MFQMLDRSTCTCSARSESTYLKNSSGGSIHVMHDYRGFLCNSEGNKSATL